MPNYSLTHVSDAVLLRELAELIARDRLTTSEILAHIAEVDARAALRSVRVFLDACVLR